MRLTAIAIGVLLGLSLTLAPTSVHAIQIPVELNTYSSNYENAPTDLRHARNAITGSPDSFAPSGNHWLTNFTTTGSITWSLNGRHTLNTIDVYNYRETAIPQARGAQDINVFTSNDYGLTYSLFSSETAAASPLSGPNTPTTINLGSVTATNVRFDITSNYGDGAMGLNEVTFHGTPLQPTVQVPITVSAFSTEFAGREAAKTVDGVFETTAPGNMWLSAFGDNSGMPTITFSLGATPVVLDHLNVWNYNETSFAGRGLNDIQIELFNASMVSLGLAVDAADANTIFSLSDAKGQLSATMDTLGISSAPAASFFKIITLTNTSTDSGLGGLTEVQAFAAVPEPGTGMLISIGISSLVYWRKRRSCPGLSTDRGTH